MKEKQYYNLDKDTYLAEDYYDKLATNANPVSKFIHNGRYEFVYQKVKSIFKPGNKIVDFACGNCSWNKDKLPVTGIDSSKRVLEYAKSTGKISEYYIDDVENPTTVKDNEYDTAIITETLEHLINPKKSLTNIKNKLKVGGYILISVPYDTNLSLWKPMFSVLCFVKGTLHGQELYKNNCGHINNYSPKDLKKLVEEVGFEVVEQDHFWYFTQFILAKKV